MDWDHLIETILDSFEFNLFVVVLLTEFGLSRMMKRNFSSRNIIPLYAILFALRLFLDKL